MFTKKIFIDRIKEINPVPLSILWIILLCFMMIGYSMREKEIYNLEDYVVENRDKYITSLDHKDSIISSKNHEIDSLEDYLDSKEYLEFLIYKEAHLDDFKVNLSRVDYKTLNLMVEQADKYNIPYTIYFRLIDMESGFSFIPNKSSGAFGYMQLMPQTFRSYYNKLNLTGGHTRENNIIIGSYKLNKNYKKWRCRGKKDCMSWEYTLAEYNTGEGKMQIKKEGKVVGFYIPSYTKGYISYIMRYYN